MALRKKYPLLEFGRMTCQFVSFFSSKQAQHLASETIQIDSELDRTNPQKPKKNFGLICVFFYLAVKR